MTKIWLLIVSAIIMTGCVRELPSYFIGNDVIASVEGVHLTKQDMSPSIPKGVSGEDSLSFTEIYINHWITRQLKIQEAERVFIKSANDIDRMVEEYRQTLLIRKLEQQYVDQLIDTLITEEQIQSYYTQNSPEFRLDHSLVKGRIVRFEKIYRQAKSLKKLMASEKPADQEEFLSICKKNGFEFIDLTSEWVDAQDFIKHLPVEHSKNQEKLLDSSEVESLNTDSSNYFFQITEVLKPGDTTPLEMVQQQIRRTIFNKRQSEVLRSQEELLYNNAVQTKVFKIYESN